MSNNLITAGIGEVLWDVVGNSETLGGAPVNFAYHAGQLGCESYAISSIGYDQRGDRALRGLADWGVDVSHITRVEKVPTGYVQARVDAEGVAEYEFPDSVAWDHIRIDTPTIELAARIDAVCFGSLAQRSEKSRGSIARYLQRLPSEALKVFDLNLRQNFYSAEIIRSSLNQADMLKLNDDEIKVVAELEGLKGTLDQQLRLLAERYELSLVILTRGGQGSLLVSPDSLSEHQGYQVDIVDTIGAGDSFTAVIAVGMLKGYSLEIINEHANLVAAYVCGRQGAMVPLPERLRAF